MGPVASYGTVFLAYFAAVLLLHVLFTLSSALKFLSWILHDLTDCSSFCIRIAVE